MYNYPTVVTEYTGQMTLTYTKPSKLMKDKPTSVQKEYNHLFVSHIDSLFAVTPSAFGELMTC